MLSKVTFFNLGPLHDVTLRLDETVNVFVGPNNSGKTIALTAIGDILVYPFNVPEKYVSEASKYRATFKEANQTKTVSGDVPINNISKALKERMKNSGFTVFVPAIRWSSDFRSKGPTLSKRRASFENEEVDAEWNEYLKASGNMAPPSSALHWDSEVAETDPDLALRAKLATDSELHLKDQTIIEKMIALDYRAYREKTPNIRRTMEVIGSIISEITEGFSVSFCGIKRDSRGLYPSFNTPDGELPLNVLSQGTQSLIQWLTLFVLGHAEYHGFPADLSAFHSVLIIDEIDAHLHPSWQRRILPALYSHFPKIQIFCSTHSPLMLTGLRKGQVHLFQRTENGTQITSNEQDIFGWSVDEVLQSILGVASPTDLATADKIEELEQLYRNSRRTSDDNFRISKLRSEIGDSLHNAPMNESAREIGQMIERRLKRKSSKRGSRKSRKGPVRNRIKG